MHRRLLLAVLAAVLCAGCGLPAVSRPSAGRLLASSGHVYDPPSIVTPPPAWSLAAAGAYDHSGVLSPSSLAVESVSLATQDAGDLSGTALARQLGREGEGLVPGAGNTARIPSASGTAAYRIPDILDPEAGVVGEVKNVGRLSYTAQLRDFADYAQEQGYRFDLYVRPTTRPSGRLQQEIGSGGVSLRYLP